VPSAPAPGLASLGLRQPEDLMRTSVNTGIQRKLGGSRNRVTMPWYQVERHFALGIEHARRTDDNCSLNKSFP
jgi:hypothetical protein